MSAEANQSGPTGEQRLRDQVAANVRAELARLNVPQVRVAQALGLTQQAVSQKLGGHRPFTLDDLEVIAPLVGMSADELVGGGRTPRPLNPVGASVGKLPRLDSNQQPAD